MKILFVLDKRVDAGSIHAVAHYVRAGAETGHQVALYGQPDPRYPAIPFATDPGAFDHVIFIAETGLQLSGLQLTRLVASVSRSRRVIVDTDGMFNPATTLHGYDYNHRNEDERRRWLARHAPLASTVLQPTIGASGDGTLAVPFFGYDPSLQVPPGHESKPYDVVYVGHNWWRWREMSALVLPAIQSVRARLDDICFIGSWWDSPPSWAEYLSLEPAFQVDPDWLQRVRIQIRPAVPYTEVVRAMTDGRVNIMLQRPLLRQFRLLTAKYFEIFYADTIPLVALERAHAESVYGPAGRELALDGDVETASAKIVDAIENPRRYREIVQAVRCHLEIHHSYRRRVEELVDTLGRDQPVEEYTC